MKKISLILIFVLTFLFVDAARMYRGNSTYISDCEYTYSNGKVYRGNSTYIYDIMFTYYNNNIYNRNSTYSSDIIMTYEGYIPMSVLIICAMNLQ